MAKKKVLKEKLKKLKQKVEQLREEKKKIEAALTQLKSTRAVNKSVARAKAKTPASKAEPPKKTRTARKTVAKAKPVKQGVVTGAVSKSAKGKDSGNTASNGKPATASKRGSKKTGAAPKGRPAKSAATAPKRRQTVKKPASGAAKIDMSKIGTASAGTRDDLTRITGIGPSAEKKLNAIGIFTYRQISKMTSSDLASVTEAAGPFRGRTSQDTWVKQAKDLLKK